MGDLNAFREDARRWLEEHAPPSMRTPPATADDVCWGGKKGTLLRRRRGAGSRSWRSAAGRRRRGRASTAAAGSRRRRRRSSPRRWRSRSCARPLIGFGLEMIGPLLLQSGNEEQKREHLPRIVARRDPLVPGLLRAGRRLRPGRACRRAPCATATTSSSTARRSGRRTATRSDWMFILVRTDTDAEAGRHHVPPDGHGRARRAGAADQADQRRVAVLRDVPHRRARAAPQRRRPG